MPRSLDALKRVSIPRTARDPRSDAELLTRFLERGEESAFEVLVERHTPGIRAVCRGWLRCSADIEDAIQATFLVLVKRGGTIRNRAVMGSWLYGVATHVSRRLRRQLLYARSLPENVPAPHLPLFEDEKEILLEEVTRLPEKYRLPIQLCYQAGLTTAEAAERLGWPRGTVLTRLAGARTRLRKSLIRRGLEPVTLAGLGALAQAAVVTSAARVTVAAAQTLREGRVPPGVTERTLSLVEGVIRAMLFSRTKIVIVVMLLLAGLAGLGLHHWATAADGKSPGGERADARLPGVRDPEQTAPPSKETGRAEDARAQTPGRRREAVIRLPLGTFVKDIEVPQYGAGRVTWNYEEERVTGLIEGSVLGGEFEVATEAEFSLSSNGTIYGLLTSVRLTHVKMPVGKEFEELQPWLGLVQLAEPLLNEFLVDLPFSYKFRVHKDRLILSDFRILLAGPNPLNKLAILGDNSTKELTIIMMYFQALGTALEGSYMTVNEGAREKSAPPARRPLFPKPREGSGKAPVLPQRSTQLVN